MGAGCSSDQWARRAIVLHQNGATITIAYVILTTDCPDFEATITACFKKVLAGQTRFAVTTSPMMGTLRRVSGGVGFDVLNAVGAYLSNAGFIVERASFAYNHARLTSPLTELDFSSKLEYREN